jgi:hypothetical protein
VSLRSGLVLAAALFATLASLVAAGVFTHLDQWAVDHLMPGAHFHHGNQSLSGGLVPLLHTTWSSGYSVAVNVVTLPASFLVALGIVGSLSRLLGLALLVTVGVELLCKEVLTRPAIYDGTFHIVAFNSSFPSGHTLRTVLVAIAVSSRWPRARPFAAVWAVAALVLILLAGWHVPTDIAGGIVLALLGAGCARALRRRRLPLHA